MPITSSNIGEYFSGGSGNTNPAASLGGVISTTELTDNTTHNIWDQVSSAESSAGDTEYRCIYVKNEHGSLTWQNAAVYISSNTTATDTLVEIALGSSAINATEQTIANESTAPTLPGANGTNFSSAAGSGNALAIGNIPFGQSKAIWIKRVITAAAGATNDDTYVLAYVGDTSA